ncbi:competence/damage-inducible protein A [Carnobacteriaceae bacterium zg-C25]|nr:competence/damage-inducible protein A [Carnobacteriaceae bacterium zg-C25]
MLKAEIIAVGTELLMGQVVNTNATTISRFLNAQNIGTYYQTVVGDNPNRLLEQLKQSSQRSDIIAICGGLGPTQDDITKEVIATFLNDELVQHELSKQKIVLYFEKSGRIMSENNLKQSLILKKCQPLMNHNGFATGMFIQKNDVTYIVLPGPPRELSMMLETEVKPVLSKFTQEQLSSVLLRFADIGESLLAEKIEDIVSEQTNPTVAIYANPGLVDVRVTASGQTSQEANRLMQPVIMAIQNRLSEFYYGRDEETLEHVVVALLKQKQWSIATAESVTGGLCGAKLTQISGVSSVYCGGVVTYTNEMKQTILGVNESTLHQFGAISAECALEMAQNVKKLCQSDIGISFTGIADKTSVENKPSGRVYIGIATPTQQKVVELQLHRDRELNRQLAVQKGFIELRKMLLEV